MKNFDDVWKTTGRNYGTDALEQVRLGWEMAIEAMTEREIIFAALKRIYGEPEPPTKFERERPVFSRRLQEKLKSDPALSIAVYDGYAGFVTDFEFDSTGNLVRCSVWE